MSADIGVFHLLTNQEGNLSRVHRYVYRLRRGYDVVGPLVALAAQSLPNISDMLSLEFRAPQNIGQRGMLFRRVPPTLRGG